jgi:hypothetical protein
MAVCIVGTPGTPPGGTAYMAASTELWMVTAVEREQVGDGVLALLFSHILDGYTQICIRINITQ